MPVEASPTLLGKRISVSTGRRWVAPPIALGRPSEFRFLGQKDYGAMCRAGEEAVLQALEAIRDFERVARPRAL